MAFFGRSRELGRLRALLDSRAPVVVRVSGVRGGGKSALVGRAVMDSRAILHTCPPLPALAQRAGLWHQLTDEASTPTTPPQGESDQPPTWDALLGRLRDEAGEGDRPLVLVLDDAHRLTEARARFVRPLVETLSRDRAGPPLHIVLVGRDDGLPATKDLDPLPVETVAVDPLPLRAAVPMLPGARPVDQLVAYGVFGGIPRVLTSLDPSRTTGTNLRRLVLDRDGSLADAGERWLERDLQTPSRYYAIMRALSFGETDWSTIRDGIPDLTGSGQLAPYIARLVSLGLIVARKSLDASPRSRSTRYSIADPFLAFWFRAVLPHRVGRPEPEADYYALRIRPALDGQTRSVFPALCRQHMRFDAIETLGANARESGSLWGASYELPLAGLLTSGAAFYGACGWSFEDRRDSPVARIEAAMRETRYGFGRERRIRLVFTAHSAPVWLRREVARNRDALIIDADALLGR